MSEEAASASERHRVSAHVATDLLDSMVLRCFSELVLQLGAIPDGCCNTQESTRRFLIRKDLLCQVLDPDEWVYEMATSYIETRYPKVEATVRENVQRLIVKYLGTKDCSGRRIAAELSMHPRTLQRQLQIEGTSFGDIKDEVRRDIARHCLQSTDMPIRSIVDKVGYSEASVFTRSCQRWFAATPTQLRLRSRDPGCEPTKAA